MQLKASTQYSKFAYVLSVCFCAASCKNLGAPFSSSSSSLSAESSCWRPRCGVGLWPSIPLWLLPSPPRLLVDAQLLFSAAPLPGRHYQSCLEHTEEDCATLKTAGGGLTFSFRLSYSRINVSTFSCRVSGWMKDSVYLWIHSRTWRQMALKFKMYPYNYSSMFSHVTWVKTDSLSIPVLTGRCSVQTTRGELFRCDLAAAILEDFWNTM